MSARAVAMIYKRGPRPSLAFEAYTTLQDREVNTDIGPVRARPGWVVYRTADKSHVSTCEQAIFQKLFTLGQPGRRRRRHQGDQVSGESKQ